MKKNRYKVLKRRWELPACARAYGITRLSLETGSMDYFRAARALYARRGFEECGPYGEYVLDPNSVFITRVAGET